VRDTAGNSVRVGRLEHTDSAMIHCDVFWWIKAELH
jgi:hypothetical protein